MRETIEQARAYLHGVPGAVSGQQGHKATFKTALLLVQDFDLDDDLALDLLREWNGTCSPSWPESVLARKISEARKKIDPAKIGRKMRGGRTERPARRDPVEQWAGLRGFSPGAIRTMGGRPEGCYIGFPMFVAGQEVGLRLRRPDGGTFRDGNKARSSNGSTMGLILSQGMQGAIPEHVTVLICEGEPNGCALAHAGAEYVAVMPSAMYYRMANPELQRLLTGHKGPVVMFPDAGDAGIKCARLLATALKTIGIELMISPPNGVDDLDDRLKRESDGRAALAAWIGQATPARLIYADESTAGERPILELHGGARSITDCATVIYKRLATSGRYFLRGDRVSLIDRRDGEVCLSNVDPEAMRSIPESYFRIFAWRSNGSGEAVLKPTTMSREQAAAVLACKEAYEHLPVLRGLSGCPLIMDDGRVIGPGYDPISGIYVTGKVMPEPMPVDKAVSALNELLADYDFVSEGDRSRALASLITPALRLGGFLDLVPADVAEADQSQSGKTLRQKIVAAIYGETPQPVAQRSQGGVGSLDESLASRLYAGRPFIQLDNLRGKVDSPYLESLMTSDRDFPVRIPHRGEVMIDPRRIIILLTSNAAEMTVDMANRSYIIRIRKRPKDYRFRRYPEGNVLDHVRAAQPHYLGAVFAVIGKWIEQGRPQSDEAGHDFRVWARTLDWIVREIFGAAPLMAGHGEAKQRVSNPGLTFMRQIAVAVMAASGEGQGWTAKLIYELAEASDIRVPGLREWDDQQGPRRVGAVITQVLGGRASLAIDGIVLAVDERPVKRDDGKGNFTQKIYSFKASAPINPRSPVERETLLENPPFFKEVNGSTGAAGEMGERGRLEPVGVSAREEYEL